MFLYTNNASNATNTEFRACVIQEPWAPAGFFPGVGNEGSEGRKSPNRVQEQLPGALDWIGLSKV